MIPVVERDMIDGVTVLRSNAIAGRHIAALTFRVGRFDEDLPSAGVTHIVEHLTLAGHTEAEYAFNASVGGRFTRFYVETGDPSDISTYLAALCAGLTADHGAILDRERRIVRTEAAGRGDAGALGTCLVERYGARGPGLRNYQEFGLERLAWADVAAWRERWFTAGNAVLWIAGDVPAGLRLPLPDAPAMPLEQAVPVPVTLPGYVSVPARGGIGVSLVSDRSYAAHAAIHVLQRRLTHALRHEHGVSYHVALATETVDREHVHTFFAADALPEQTSMAGHVLLTTFEALADDGCDDAELEGYARRMRESFEGLGGPAAILDREATAILSGRSVLPAADALQRALELTGPEVGKAAQALRESMIVAVPGMVPAVQGRMDRLPEWSARTISGQVHKPATRSGSAPSLITSDEGVMLAAGPGRQVTVRYEDAAALVQWNDGKQALVGNDGFTIQVDPAQWKGGAAITAAIAARMPASMTVRLDRPGPASSAHHPGPASAGARRARGKRATAGRLAATALRRRSLLVTTALVVIGIGTWAVIVSPDARSYSVLTLGLFILARVGYANYNRKH